MASTTTHLLHALEIPDPSICRETELYVRCTERDVIVNDRGVRLGPGATADFNTYFNCCTVAAWNRVAPLRDLAATVDADGPLTVEIWTTDSEGSSKLIDATADSGPVTLVVPSHRDLTGICWLRVRSHDSHVTIRGGSWHTSSAPRRGVRLGVVMTTFNRPTYVERNLRILSQYAEQGADRLRDVHFTIVDNGRNLEVDPEAHPFALDVVSNPNLGGAGGFARGLIEHRARGWATHIVFADDDILLPPALIDRTAVFCSYAEREDQCLSSSMLDESDPVRQYECGAGFNTRGRHPAEVLRGNLDLTEPASLVANAERLPIDYAAWWFFAFPISLTDDNPLPVFVRGDDVEFGLSHTQGLVEVMNGVGVWHQNFDYKNTPVTFHLEARNHPLVSVLTDPGYSRGHLIGRFGPMALRFMLALKYASGEHVLAGICEFLAGPERWLRLDHEAEFTRINASGEERPGPLVPAQLAAPYVASSGAGRSPWALLTLGGHLIPRRASRRTAISAPIQSRQFSTAVGREEIIYLDRPSGHGFVARRDRRRFFAGLTDLARTVLRVWREFPAVADRYRAARGSLVDTAYWRRQFETDHVDPRWPRTS